MGEPTVTDVQSSSGPVPTTNGTSRPTAESLVDAIVALEDQFPPPDEQEILADCRWVQERWGTEEFAPYRGEHVAVYNGAIVGQGDDTLQMQLDLARRFGVHPQRVVIVYIDPPFIEPPIG